MKTTGETISDEEIEKILVSIYENENCNDPEYYIKALGDKKLSKVLRKRYGIIVNHKKIYRMRKELGLLRKYKKHTKHARKRPKNHEVSERNKYWEADIKFIPTEKDGYISVNNSNQKRQKHTFLLLPRGKVTWIIGIQDTK